MSIYKIVVYIYKSHVVFFTNESYAPWFSSFYPHFKLIALIPTEQIVSCYDALKVFVNKKCHCTF